MTTGTKTHLTQRVYEHKHANGNQTQVSGPRRSSPPTSNVTPEMFTDDDPPKCSPDLQHDQLSQLCEIIAEIRNGLTLTKLLACPLMFLLSPPPGALTTSSTTPRGRSHRVSHMLSKMAAEYNNWCPVFYRLPRVPPLSCIWELKTTSLCHHCQRNYTPRLLNMSTSTLMTYCQTKCTHTPPMPPPTGCRYFSLCTLPAEEMLHRWAILLARSLECLFCALPFPFIRNSPHTSLYTRAKFANLAESSRHQPGLCMIQPSGTWLPPIPPWPGLE